MRFDELGNELNIKLSTDEKTWINIIGGTEKDKKEEADNEEFKNKVKQASQEECEVTPGLEMPEPGNLETTVFKAKRVEDE